MSFPRESIGWYFCFIDGFLQKSPSHRFHATALAQVGMTWKGDFCFDLFTVPKSDGTLRCRRSSPHNRLQWAS